ncbi:CDP-glucose 4,6-dehydratase [Candidatus Pelagibacter sp.]|nr:CDP-glucose 4,6-dehydratase [Candidatus Pelagibacter sp.]
MFDLKKVYKGKKVLVTGHTGFKGSWLVTWLNLLGAKVIGVSKGEVSKPSHFNLLGIRSKIKNYYLDIDNFKRLNFIFKKEKPEFLFHLAAQSLVIESYINPLNTFRTNSIGVANILECIRNSKTLKSAIIVTSDKCYKNTEKKTGYKEIERLAGEDPYSSSKSCAELIFSTYCKLIQKNSKTQIVSLRAGNVIGGGDWAKNRIIPDLIKSIEKKKFFVLRNPSSTRPWQHVLEPLKAYLIIAAKIKGNKKFMGESYNVGPNSSESITVKKLIKKFTFVKDVKLQDKKEKKIKEAKLLSLDVTKIRKTFNIKPTLTLDQTADYISKWYFEYFKDKKNVYLTTTRQIKKYSKSSNLKI